MSEPPVSSPARWVRPRDLLVSVVVWTAILVLFTLARALDTARPQGPVDVFFLRVLLGGVLWMGLTPVVLSLAERLPLEAHRWIRRAVLHAVLGLLLAHAIDAVTQQVRAPQRRPPVQALPPGCAVPPGEPLPPACPRPPSGLRTVRGAVLPQPARLFGYLFLYLAILAAGHARAYQARSRAREAEAARLSALLATARLDALRMQLNPHFLFNTLNAISALAERDPAGVRRVVARLSALLRRVLDETREREVPLADELAFLDDYLDIQRVRFGDRLATEISAAPDVADALVPALVLQPLVENAVEHGVARLEDRGGRVQIRATREGDRLVIQVIDDGPGLTADIARERVGLSNTRARLAALYGDAGHLRLEGGASRGFTATVTLPFHLQPLAA